MKIATNAHGISTRAEQVSCTYAIGEQTVKKLEAEKVCTVSFTANTCSQVALFGFERSASPQGTSSGNTRCKPSLHDVMNIEEIRFDEEPEISLFSKNAYNVEGTTEITRKIQAPSLLIFHTSAGLNLISKSVVPPSCRIRIFRWIVPTLQTRNC